MGVRGSPGNVRGDVTVLVESGERYERSLDIPDVDSEVNAEGAAAEIIFTLRSPLDSAYRPNGVYSVVQTVHLVPFLGEGVPHLDRLVPAGGGEHVLDVRVPVAGEDVVVVSGPLLLAPVTPPDVPQLDLPVLGHGAELVVAVRVDLHVPDGRQLPLCPPLPLGSCTGLALAWGGEG